MNNYLDRKANVVIKMAYGYPWEFTKDLIFSRVDIVHSSFNHFK